VSDVLTSDELAQRAAERREAEVNAHRQAAEWAESVARTLPRTSGELDDPTGIPIMDIYENRPEGIDMNRAVEALNELIRKGKAVRRGPHGLSVLARRW